MKKLILFCIMFFFYSSVVFSQWSLQTSPTSKTLKHVKAVDVNILWASGYNGVVLKTHNGGSTWIQSTLTDTAYHNISIDAIDSLTAWVTGTKDNKIEAKIWKTTDGGITWKEQWYGSPAYGNSILMLDSLNGIAFFDYAGPAVEWLLLTTSDGGTTWNKVPQTNMPQVDSINVELGLENSLVNFGDKVWFSSYSQKEARIYISTDKGLNWSKSGPLLRDALERSLYLAPVSELNLVALGGSGLPGFSYDGGITWTFPRTHSIGIFATAITCIPNTSTLIAVGLSGKSMISKDYGVNWTRLETTPEAADLHSVEALSETKTWSAGSAGYINMWTGQALPVELLSFTAKSIGRKVHLEWKTGSEINNKGFEVERRSGSEIWIPVSFQKGTGTTSDISKYAFTDDVSNLKETSFSYRLKQINYDGSYEYSAEQVINISAPLEFIVNQNYPNPFNPSTNIEYGIPYESNVRVLVYDALGQMVTELADQVQAAGFHEVNWNAGNASTGIYFYIIKALPLNGAKEFTSIRKMMLVK